MKENALTILGSSSALPTSQRFPTAQVLQMLGRFFLIDCGEGTQIQLRRSNISFTRIQSIFISHLHGDHYLGIFGVLSTFNLLGRKNPLTIYAPKGFDKIVRFQLKYLDQHLSYSISFVDLPNEPYSCIFSDKKLDVFAFQLDHRISCWGFYFVQKESILKIRKDAIELYNLSIHEIVSIKHGSDLVLEDNRIISNRELTMPQDSPFSYAFVSDTLFKPEIATYIKGVRLLYHEATFLSSMNARASETFHSTAKQAAQFAVLADATKLILGHFSARYKSSDMLLAEAKAIFPNTEAANDLDVFSL
jgi:ribonuclease Z